MSKREEKINSIISFLEKTKHADLNINKYAISENIIFFKAIKSFITYIYWLLSHARKIRGTELLELADFPFPEAHYDFYQKMIQVEKNKFPGLVKPLVDEISKFILNRRDKTLLLSLGSGGMEIERQVLESLQNHHVPLLIVAVDSSAIAGEFAKKNMEKSGVSISLVDKVTTIELLEKFNNLEKTELIIIKNNIFDIYLDFSGCKFDLSYSSLFLHHLNVEQKSKLKKGLSNISNFHIDHDGYKSWINMIPQSIVGWNNPVFLNSEIFSNLRFGLKRDLKTMKNKMRFWSIGYYMIQYDYSSRDVR